MGIARDLGIDYVNSEIEKTRRRLEIYNELYQFKKIKCITLKRLIDLKENELKILKNLYDIIKSEDAT